jgi:hypothetical protein
MEIVSRVMSRKYSIVFRVMRYEVSQQIKATDYKSSPER